MDKPRFVIESSEVESMAKKLGLNSVQNLLPVIVRSTRKLARTPISHFDVSAVGLSTDGRIFVGVNLEFPGLPLNNSVHAEQFLIGNLSVHPQTRLSHVVVSAYPCGHCRQFLQEIRGAPDIEIFVLPNDEDDETYDQIHGFPDGNNVRFRPLSYFLPHRFGPDDLLDKGVPLILEKSENSLILDANVINPKTGDSTNGCLVNNELILAALDAANRSHSPYSKCPSGVALLDVDRNVYKGCYMESAAYNPSIGPAQSAIIAYLAAGPGFSSGEDNEWGYDRLVEAVLVEKEGDIIVRQEETVRLFFKNVSPKCKLHVFHCKTSSSPSN